MTHMDLTQSGDDNPFRPALQSSLEIKIKPQGMITHVQLRGLLCHRDVPFFREDVMALINRGRTFLIVDCSLVQRIDSVGIGTLINLADHCVRAGGCMMLIRPALDALANLIRNLTGGNRSLLPMFGCLADAHEALREYCSGADPLQIDTPRPETMRDHLNQRIREIDGVTHRSLGETVLMAIWRYWSQHPELTEDEVMDLPEYLITQLTVAEAG